MDGTLEVRLLGTPLMRIANGQGPALQEGRVEHIRDVSLLSAGWRERKPDTEAVRSGWSISSQKGRRAPYTVSGHSIRIRAPAQGRIGRRHQEEWAQAAGVGRREKFAFERLDPGLDDLLALLAREGAAGEVENGMEAVGACILLGHTDMHRKNPGIRPPRLRGRVRLAPLYDASSSSGRAQWITRRLALPAGGGETPDAFWAEAVGTLAGKTTLGAEERCGS